MVLDCVLPLPDLVHLDLHVVLTWTLGEPHMGSPGHQVLGDAGPVQLIHVLAVHMEPHWGSQGAVGLGVPEPGLPLSGLVLL